MICILKPLKCLKIVLVRECARLLITNSSNAFTSQKTSALMDVKGVKEELKKIK